mmetsp:Transcript_7900/g.9167  ORF Transcript_7900/g.9167 Transcript_7900/m.9167 type:complete len:84 (+) Transcript_7900:244-495(+)
MTRGSVAKTTGKTGRKTERIGDALSRGTEVTETVIGTVTATGTVVPGAIGPGRAAVIVGGPALVIADVTLHAEVLSRTVNWID